MLVDGNQIDDDDLALLPQTEAHGTDAPTTITDIERDAIERALAATSGNRRHAAARLGMPLRTFYDKLKRYGISIVAWFVGTAVT
jgi:transcriptional regulator of acetoin/glycerol metabolism